MTRKVNQWCVSIPPKLSETGKRQRRFFETKQKAQGEALRIRARMENHGTAAKVLTPAQEEQAAAAFDLLSEAGCTAQLSEIVGGHIEAQRQRDKSVTLAHAWKAYIKQLEHEGSSTRHRKNHERTLKGFAEFHEKQVVDLTASDIEAVIGESSKSYYNVQLRELRSVLNYAVEKGWLQTSPIATGARAGEGRIAFKKRKLGEVKIYTPEQIKKLLDATKDKYPELVPAMALMIFAGIRPDPLDGEIVRVNWSHINLEDKDKRIVLPGSITKTGKQRTVKIRPALASWLQWHQKRGGATTGLVCPDKGQPLRKKLTEIFKAAEVERIQDGLRHSFASYLAKTEGLDKAEKELGHQGDRALLNRHYRTDVSDAAAKKFWALRAPTS